MSFTVFISALLLIVLFDNGSTAARIKLSESRKNGELTLSLESQRREHRAGMAKPETPGETFMRAFKLAWQAAVGDPSVADLIKGDKVKDPGEAGKPKISLNFHKDINNQLAKLRQMITGSSEPETEADRGLRLIHTFQDKIIEKYDEAGTPTAGSKSGSIIFMLPWHETTGLRYILKSEDKAEFMDSVPPVLQQYVARFDENIPCYVSTMPRMLLVFEPLKGTGSKVNNKIFILSTHVNVIPPRPGVDNEIFRYDIKHSRPTPECTVFHPKNPDHSQGMFGDLLKEFGESWRQALATQKKLGNRNKNGCFLSAVDRDLKVLDSRYEDAIKLVDQSLMIFVIKLAGDEETQQETEIADASNNIFRMDVDDGGHTAKYLVVAGIIDLFARKTTGSWKWMQSHREKTDDFLFQMPKFSLYPHNMRCMIQYMFYYQNFQENLIQDDVKFGGFWDCPEYPNIAPTYTKADAVGSTKEIHRLLQGPDHRGNPEKPNHCALLKTCHQFLHDTVIKSKFQECCAVGNLFTKVSASASPNMSILRKKGSKSMSLGCVSCGSKRAGRLAASEASAAPGCHI